MTETKPDRTFRAGALAALALVLALQWAAVTGQSLVGDAPYHLLAGHQALRYGQNLLNLEHPPLVKWVAALPLLAEAPLAAPTTVDRALETSLAIFDDPGRLHRVRLASRGVVLLVFGLPFLGACYFLGREAAGGAAGLRTGAVLALFAGLSLPILPNLSILQTDTAVALGFTATAAAALAYLRRPGLSAAAAVGLGAGLALAAKFSGVAVLPTAAAAFAFARGPGWRLRLAHAGAAAAAAIALVWTTYAVANRRYDPEAGRDAIVRYCRNQALIVDDRMRPYEQPLLAVERHAPNLAQWLTGFVGIRLQNEIGVYPTYAFGVLSSQGRWWYFPALLLVKTPLVVLLASAGALFAGRRLPWASRPVLLVGGVTVAVYLGIAMTSNYNLGARHLLPVLPLLYLPAVCWAAERRWRSALVVGALAAEALALAPLWMSATNTWWLGPYNPTRTALSIGDAEYRQNFVALAETARRRKLEPLWVVYPGVAEKEIRAYLPDALVARPGVALEPGAWYAVSVSLEQYLPAIPRARPEDVRGYDSLVRLAEAWGPYWREIAGRGEDHGWVAGTFHLYRLRD
jgi:4-amino-4-deoxy-L-arabinose transferase-like glycosyltransferase